MAEIPAFNIDIPPDIRIGRSEIERYTICPAQGVWAEKHPDQTGSLPATSGQEAHEALSFAIGCYLEQREMPWETLTQTAQMSRPDVQPDVLQALRPVVGSLGHFLQRMDPQDILRYDGGTEARSGQIAYDMIGATQTTGPVRATCEVDLLVANPKAKTILTVIDWKTGRGPWTHTKVAASFQFAFYAMLVLRNYPDAERVEVVVWMTRMNKRTAPVTFTRRDADDMEGRVLQAYKQRRQALKDGAEPETWPSPVACCWCPCIAGCPHADRVAQVIAADPVTFAADTQLLAMMVEEREARQDAYVDAHGAIVGDGWSYDRHKPKPRKPAAKYKETT